MLKKESFSVTFNEVRDWDRDGLRPKIIYNLHVTLDWLQKLDGRRREDGRRRRIGPPRRRRSGRRSSSVQVEALDS